VLREKYDVLFWIAFCTMLVAACSRLSFQTGDNDGVEVMWQPAGLAAMVLFLTLVRRKALRGSFGWYRTILPGKILPSALAVAFFLTVAALAIQVRWSSELLLHFGLPLRGILMVVCFVLSDRTTTSARHLPSVLTCALVGLVAIHYWPISDSAEVGTASSSSNNGWHFIPITDNAGVTMVNALCAVLLGRVLWPFLRTRDVAVVKGWRTVARLGVVLVLQFVGGPAATGRGFQADGGSLAILGGSAFVAGLVWQRRGLFTPLVIQIMALLACLVAASEEGQVQLVHLTALPAITFSFAFFGLLSNRYGSAHGAHGGVELGPSPTAAGQSYEH
jgi:hypothetical protein